MKFIRPVAAAVALSGFATLVVAVPAQAVTAPPDTSRIGEVVQRTATVSLERSVTRQVYGRKISFLAKARSTDQSLGRFPTATNDRISLQQRVASGPWRTVATSTDMTAQWRITATATATYRVAYSGGDRTVANGSTEQWQPTVSNALPVKVQRQLTTKSFVKGDRAGFRGKVSPKFTGRVVYQTKVPGRGWRTLRKLRLTGGKKFSVIMNGAANQKFRVVVPRTAHLLGASATYTLSYRWAD